MSSKRFYSFICIFLFIRSPFLSERTPPALAPPPRMAVGPSLKVDQDNPNLKLKEGSEKKKTKL